MGKPFIDRAGQKYGRLTAMAYLGKVPGKTKPYWSCLCDCGNTVQVTTSNLATGHAQSCGCLLIEEMQSRRLYEKEHAAEYAIWRGIRQRTGERAGRNAQWYGNVSMSQEWKDSFHEFLNDMGKRPSPTHSVERKDLNQGYCASNCVWATSKEQANNRSTNRVVTYKGVSLTIAQWSEITGIQPGTLNARLTKYSWSIEKALTTPPNQGKH